jgi:hypothetical protein
MPFFEKQNKMLFFSHIPKTAGTSIYHFFKTNGYNVLFYSSSKIGVCNYQHRHNKDPELLKQIELYKPDYSFTIMRDPVDRIKSEFFYFNTIIRKKQITPSNQTQFSPEVFHKWVETQFMKYKTNQYILDNHIRPQTEFLHKDIEIFKFDSLNQAIQKISKNPKAKLVQRNKSNTKLLNPNWVPLQKTIDLIKRFYREDSNIHDSL